MVNVLIATVPWRLRSCQRLLTGLESQTRVPSTVTLVLDGYTPADPRPASTLVKYTHVSGTPRGPGSRWRAVEMLAPDSTLVVFDDDVDIFHAPRAVELLAERVEREDVAVSAAGHRQNGTMLRKETVYPTHGAHSIDGSLIALFSGHMALRVGCVAGLYQFAQSLTLGFDPFGPAGDDEAVLSAWLWKQKVPMFHVQGLGSLRFDVSSTDPRCEMALRGIDERTRNVKPGWQRHAIRKACGWPWPE